MKKYKLLYVFCWVGFFCESIEKNNEVEFERYREILSTVSDSSQVAQIDSSSTNPILASLQENYDWSTEKKKLERSPFLPGRIEVKIEKVKKPAPKPVNEIKGLDLTGIIQVGGKKKALVNGNLYEQGDRVGNLVIISIRAKHIILKSRFKIYTLNLKEK